MVPNSKLFVVTDVTDDSIRRAVLDRLDIEYLPEDTDDQKRLRDIWRKLIAPETESNGWEELKLEFSSQFSAEDVFDLYRRVFHLISI